jgi:hypothetical protein
VAKKIDVLGRVPIWKRQLPVTTSEITTSWLINKLAPALGGLFGGLGLAMLWTPRKLREKGRIASVFIAGGISAMAGFALTAFVAIQLGIDHQQIDIVIGLSWCLGLGAVAAMNWFANWVERREHLDIAEVGHEINAARKGETSTPIRAKPRTRKPPAKKIAKPKPAKP